MPQISSFSIESLNGLFNYTDCTTNGPLSDLMILYGDNGSGKTTILNLIFHLLSSESGRGHMNAIAKIPFKSLRIKMYDGSVVSAEREESVDSLPIIFKIRRPEFKQIEYRFIPERLRDRIFQEKLERELTRRALPSVASKNNKITLRIKKPRSTEVNVYEELFMNDVILPHSDDNSHKRYLAELRELGVSCYFVATDRRIKSDLIEVGKVDVRHVIESERYESGDDDVISRARTQYLKAALNNAARYLNRQIIGASNVGSKNTNDIYTELIKKVATDKSDPESLDVTTSLKNAIENLKELEAKNKEFSELGILPPLDIQTLIFAIASSPRENRTVLDKILRPYIDSLTARLYALNPVGYLIKTFLKILNELFKFKFITFSPTSGFTVAGIGKENESLDMEQLSSGEQQLLLMFCYLLISNEHQSIFIIDEPEISLNVKWQRELIDAMRKITSNSNNQIIIATHSIELLTQYSDMVVDLDPTLLNMTQIAHEPSKEED